MDKNDKIIVSIVMPLILILAIFVGYLAHCSLEQSAKEYRQLYSNSKYHVGDVVENKIGDSGIVLGYFVHNSRLVYSVRTLMNDSVEWNDFEIKDK